jgi:hypothetical protein
MKTSLRYRQRTVELYLANAPTLRLAPRDKQRLAKLASFAEGLPGCEITPAGERHLALTVRKKTFAYYLNDHHGDQRIGICCKSKPARQQALVAGDPQRFYVPAYLGAKGWVSLRLDLQRIDWDQVFNLIVDAFRLQAPKALAEQLPDRM